MPIEVACDQCSRRLRVPDKAAGKRIKCPKCGGVIRVPVQEKAPAQDQAETSEWVPAATKKTAQSDPFDFTGVDASPKQPDSAGQDFSIDKSAADSSPGWYVKIDEDAPETGPIAKSELDVWVAQGRLTADSQILQEDSDQWQWASDLYPHLEDGAAVGGQEGAEPQASPKSKIRAGMFGVFLGGFGVHRFYMGYMLIGILQIVVTLLTFGVGLWWGVVEGILILTGRFTKDAQGNPLVDENAPAT